MEKKMEKKMERKMSWLAVPVLALVFGMMVIGCPGPTGSDGGGTAVNDTGIKWTAVTDNTFSTANINCIVWGNNKFVAGANNGKMAYSSSGIYWTAVADSKFSSTSIANIAWGNNTFVAVGDNGKIAYSGTNDAESI